MPIRSTDRSLPRHAARLLLVALVVTRGCGVPEERPDRPRPRLRPRRGRPTCRWRRKSAAGSSTLKVAEGDRVNAGRPHRARSTRATPSWRCSAPAPIARRPTRSCACCWPGSRPEDIRQAEAQAAGRAGRRRRGARRSSPTRRPTSSASRRCSAPTPARASSATTRRRGATWRAQRLHGRAGARAARPAKPRRASGPARAARRSTPPARASPRWTRRSPRCEKALDDATVTAPVGGIVTEKLVDAGELVAPRTPLVVITDLDHAWANVFVDEPLVPRLTLGQPATLFTDAGGAGVAGTVTFISPKAEFTPRNVQTAEERSKLVYRDQGDASTTATACSSRACRSRRSSRCSRELRRRP